MIVLILFLLTTKCYAGPGHYECGLNGRFEYCIDDFPGCVVGCHCYPGYYFDTDTKICEPNTKLTQDYRRNLVPASYNLHGSSGAVVEPPAPAHDLAPSTGDTTPDHGDLSDWLYNQFFKTIESQVVNKTDDEPLKLGTRRSGDAGLLEPLLTRRHKSRRRKKSKRHGSRKKVIRIDDDESSDSSSESNSDSGDSGNLGSWERFEWGPEQNSPHPGNNDQQAAHRQIVMYSKKPKPPLPSFIFLPNVQTAFYPPIGLPAPLPMYPLVPVPPIHPGGQTECTGHNETTTAASAQETTTTTTTAPTPTTPASPPTPLQTPVSAQKPDLRNRNAYNLCEEPKSWDPKKNLLLVIESVYRQNFQLLPSARVLYLSKVVKWYLSVNAPGRIEKPPTLRNKLQHRPVYKPPPQPVEFSMKQYDDLDYDAMFLNDNNLLLGPDMKGDKIRDGSNFKYISELIHKDYNTTTIQPPPRNPKRYEQYFGMKPSIPKENKKRQPITPGRLDSTRRRFDQRKNAEDESYYSSLGKQIAKLIRGLDSKGIREADIKIEPPENPQSSHPFFSESSYAARTYWERFVRSPLSVRLKNFTKYDDLILSNEQLFELENQVEEATSPPALGLLELENVINTMGTIRNQIHGREAKNRIYSNHSNSSFNVSLLPRFARTHASLKPKIRTDFNTLNPGSGVIDKNIRSDLTQKVRVVSDKAKDLNESNNNSVASFLPRNIHISTKMHQLRSFIPTLTPKVQNSHFKGKKHDDRQAKLKKSNPKHENDNKPHIILAGETTFVKSKKYFFDRGSNYQFENWSME